MMAERTEGQGIVKQGHVDAPLVRRVGNEVTIACSAEQGTASEVAEHTVVLHLTEGDKAGDDIIATREDGLCKMVLLAPITTSGPMARGFGQVLLVVLEGVVTGIEEILAVKLDKRERLRCRLSCRQQEERKEQQV